MYHLTLCLRSLVVQIRFCSVHSININAYLKTEDIRYVAFFLCLRFGISDILEQRSKEDPLYVLGAYVAFACQMEVVQVENGREKHIFHV